MRRREPLLVQAVERGHARRRAYRRACAATWAARRQRPGPPAPGRRPGAGSRRRAPAIDQHVDVPARLGHQRAGAAARDARRGGRGRQGLGVGQPRLGDRVVAVGDEPHAAPDTLGERRRERDRVVGRPGRSARDGDARRREGRTKRCPYGATTIGHGAPASSPRDTGLAAEQVLADDDRVGSLAARQRLARRRRRACRRAAGSARADRGPASRRPPRRRRAGRRGDERPPRCRRSTGPPRSP